MNYLPREEFNGCLRLDSFIQLFSPNVTHRFPVCIFKFQNLLYSPLYNCPKPKVNIKPTRLLHSYVPSMSLKPPSFQTFILYSFIRIRKIYYLVSWWFFLLSLNKMNIQNRNHCRVKTAGKTTNITKSRKITIMNCLEIITILFPFFSCLHFDCFLGKIHIASNLPCCQMQKTTICPMPCAANFEQLPYRSIFMFERCQPNGSLNKEEIASSAFIVDYLLYDSPGVMKARREDKSIIVGRSENPSSRGTIISSSDCLLVILSEH